jgi:hypothetical protein
MHELEQEMREGQKDLIPLLKENYEKKTKPYLKYIQPFELSEYTSKSGYVYEPDWDDVFIVIETEDKYIGFHWWTTA